MRVLISALLVILLAQSTGAIAFLGHCTESCPAEQAGAKSCLPGCPDCACCGLARMVLKIAQHDAPPVVTMERVWPFPPAPVAAPFVEDISHVPKPLFV